MSLDIDVVLQRPGFTLAAGFEAPGGVTALFGRSGAGKSTLALLLAGLLRPDRGHIRLDGAVLVDVAAGIFVPPHRRRIAAVFQEGRLFPHLSVRHNLLYGAWFNRADRSRLLPVAALLGIGGLLDRRPATLSGGEQRRVAIGRALLAAPRLLILDEPLTGLDARRKDEILPYLERLRDEMRLPMLFVSHDVEEVVRLADRLVLLDRGRVTASGPIDEVMGRLDLSGEGGAGEAGTVLSTEIVAIDRAEGLATAVFPGGRLILPAGGLSEGDRPRLHIRARDVAIATERPSGISILNVLPAMVEALQAPQDGMVDVRLSLGPARLVARITRRSAETLGLFPGKNVHALIKSVAFDRGRRSLG
jgi:molybdate transport system ATP-binding protein